MEQAFNIVVPLTWVRLKRYCELTGEPLSTLRERASNGAWTPGLHFKNLSQRTIVVNLCEINNWFNNHPHIEIIAPHCVRQKQNANVGL